MGFLTFPSATFRKFKKMQELRSKFLSSLLLCVSFWVNCFMNQPGSFLDICNYINKTEHVFSIYKEISIHFLEKQ